MKMEFKIKIWKFLVYYFIFKNSDFKNDLVNFKGNESIVLRNIFSLICIFYL